MSPGVDKQQDLEGVRQMEKNSVLRSLKEFLGIQEPPQRAPIRTEGRGRQEAEADSVLKQEAAKKHLREIGAKNYGGVRTTE